MKEQFLTFCGVCNGNCAAKVTVEDGKIVKWERDTEHGFPSRPCPSFKGLANKEINEHPDRLRYPLKRMGERGENKWQRISWDEALDTIAQKLLQLKEKYGPECLAMGVGEPKHFEFIWLQRLATSFGTPNIATPHHICGATRFSSATMTFGPHHMADPPGEHRLIAEIDKDDLPRLLVVWGNAQVEKVGSEIDWANAIVENGGKIVVVDPRRLRICKKADLWIRPRPGSDPALAMGMLKILIEEKLYDEEFVKNWTVGFEELRAEVKKFTMEDLEKTTWVPRQQIEQLARWYGTHKPAALLGRGNTWSQGIRSFQGMRVIQILRAIVTPDNIPYWNYTLSSLKQPRPRNMYLMDKYNRNKHGSVGSRYKYAVHASFIPYQSLTQGILDGKIKATLFTQCDPVISYPNARRVYEAFMKLDLNVVMNIFMVPTACIADIVLPVATSNECDVLFGGTGTKNFCALPKLVEPPGEAWSDLKIINELGKRIGQPGDFFDTDEEVLDYALAPSGVTWQEFKTKIRRFQKTKIPRKDKSGFFTTPSGKVEIVSQKAVEEYGCDPMPTWKFLSELPEPTEEYPLLLTNYCDEEFRLSAFKQIKAFRKKKPFPTVQLNPDTAEKAGMKDGDWAYIETKLGRIVQQVVIDPELDPRVAMASFGWWFPEDPANSSQWDKSNINILTDDTQTEIATGSVELRGIPCKIYKSEDVHINESTLRDEIGLKH